MTKVLIIFFFVLTLSACNDQQISTPIPETEAEVSFIESDDDPLDVDSGDSPEEQKNARLAATSATVYFQVQSDDGNKYLKTYKLEDYYFGTNPIPSILSDLTPTNTKGAKYSLIKTAGLQYIKAKSLKQGNHVVVLNNNIAYGVVTIVPTVKKLINFDLGGGSSTYDLYNTRLIRVNFDASIPPINGLYKVAAMTGATSPTFQDFVLTNNEHADACDEWANWFFDAELNAGRSVAVRITGTAADLNKLMVWARKENKPVGKLFDLTTRKGVSIKFKPKKKGY